MVRINRKWFEQKIAESEHNSLRKFASAVSKKKRGWFDHTVMSKVFSGDRQLQLDEVMIIAEILGVSYNELLEEGCGFKR